MKLQFKKLSDDAYSPTYATDGSGCFDLYSPTYSDVHGGETRTIPLDLSFNIPDGYVLLLFSRSGHGRNNGIRLANCVGVVDSDYTGNVGVILRNDSEDLFYITKGERIAQGMVIPYNKVDLVEEEFVKITKRGDNGFGSTGA